MKKSEEGKRSRSRSKHAADWLPTTTQQILESSLCRCLFLAFLTRTCKFAMVPNATSHGKADRAPLLPFSRGKGPHFENMSATMRPL